MFICESLKHAKVILKGGMATIHKIGENVCNWEMWGYTGNFMQYGNVSRKKIKENPVASKFQTTHFFSHAQHWYLKVSLDTKVLTI